MAFSSTVGRGRALMRVPLNRRSRLPLASTGRRNCFIHTVPGPITAEAPLPLSRACLDSSKTTGFSHTACFGAVAFLPMMAAPSLCQSTDPETEFLGPPDAGEAATPSRSDFVQAARSGDVTLTFRLLPLFLDGIDDPLTSIGESVLGVACAAGALPLVSRLLERGASPSVTDSRGASCLLLACEAGHAHVARRLLATAAPGAAMPDIYGLAPIHKAVAFGHVEVLRCLLEHGSDPNLPTSSVTAPEEYGSVPSRYETALHIAVRVLARDVSDARTRCHEVVDLLLRYSANPVSRDLHGDTPLHFSARRGDFCALWLLLGGAHEAGPAVATVNDAGADVLSEADAHSRLVGIALRAAVRVHPLRRFWHHYWSMYDFVGRGM